MMRRDREGLIPFTREIALRLRLVLCESGFEKTTNLGVPGSNPSGRANGFNTLRTVVCSSSNLFQTFPDSLLFAFLEELSHPGDQLLVCSTRMCPTVI